MTDPLVRTRELVAGLQDSLAELPPVSRRNEHFTQWLDAHEADVRELADIKGNAMVEQFLGLVSGTIAAWRDSRHFADSPQMTRRRAIEREKERSDCLKRLRAASDELQDMQPKRWLDQHREDVETLLSLGLPEPQLAAFLGITDSTFRNWRRDAQVIRPIKTIEEETPMQSQEETDVRTGQEDGSHGDSWRELSPSKLRQLVATDIKVLGMEEASRLWRLEKGLAPQRWGNTVHWARRKGLIDEPTVREVAQGRSHREVQRRPARGQGASEYLRGKYDGMREALMLICGHGGQGQAEEPGQ